MHIADGIISAEICAAADLLAVGAVYALGKRVEAEEVPRMGLMSAALFTVSLIHFPIAGTSVHLGLLGLAGIILGRKAFPVVFVTLLFQSLIFQHGGLISVGLNAINMGAGALLGWSIWKLKPVPVQVRAVIAGFFGIAFPAFLMSLEFLLAGYGKGIFYMMSIYLPIGVIEGVLTLSIVLFFLKVQPRILGEEI